MLIIKDTKKEEIVVAEGNNSKNYTILYRNSDINKVLTFLKHKF